MQKRTKILYVRIEPEVHRLAKQAAALRDMPVGDWVRWWVVMGMKKEGRITSELAKAILDGG